MKKHIQQLILPNSVFCQFFGREVMGLVPKYLLPSCWRYKRGFNYIQAYNVSKVFTFLPTHLPVWEQGISCQLSKQISKLFFQISALVYSVPGQTEGRRKAFFEWGNTQSYLWGEWAMLTVIKVLIILFLLKEIGNILAISKKNQ